MGRKLLSISLSLAPFFQSPLFSLIHVPLLWPLFSTCCLEQGTIHNSHSRPIHSVLKIRGHVRAWKQEELLPKSRLFYLRFGFLSLASGVGSSSNHGYIFWPIVVQWKHVEPTYLTRWCTRYAHKTRHFIISSHFRTGPQIQQHSERERRKCSSMNSSVWTV